MLSIPQLTSVVRAAPMPLYVKEQILDQVLGHHDDLLVYKDDLHKPSPLVKNAKPKHERVTGGPADRRLYLQRTASERR